MVPSIRAALAAYRPGSPDLYRAFRLMIAVDVLVVVALFLYKITSYEPNAQYYQLLVNYDHGLIRRALMGELLSWFKSQIPAWYVFALGLCAWLATLAAYLTAFGRTFGFSARTTPLLAFILGSPFFFKNFMYTIGHFDIYGCLVAIIALLLPLNFAYPAIIAAAGVFLVLQHNAHMLLYVPTIAFIAIARFHAAQRITPGSLAYGLVVGFVVLAAFVAVTWFGRPSIPPLEFAYAARERALDPIALDIVRLWYSDLAFEVAFTFAVLPENVLRIPLFLALVAAHAPLVSYFMRTLRSVTEKSDRRLVGLALLGIAAGYVVLCAVANDYSRWVSNWFTCMILALHAILLLPSDEAAERPPIATDFRSSVFGWIVTLIPRVGITKPF